MDRRSKYALAALVAVCVFSFVTLLWVGRDIYQQSPPMPTAVVDSRGQVLFRDSDIDKGQLAWRSMGGHQLGSIWGHGAYVAPDWTADWIHKEQLLWLDYVAAELYHSTFSALTIAEQDALLDRYRREIRNNSYDASTGVIVVSVERARAIKALQQYYVSLFGDDEASAEERDAYAMKNNSLVDPARREAFAAFVFWSAWAAVTERPGENYSYTNNWPYDPSIGNTITPDSVFWSIISLVLLLIGVGALVWYHAALKEEPLQGPAKDP
ncbi:nitric oxide reductase [Agaribacterium haliotis]|uniref:nitric oxide reductase n=1 Tax=Agaribacterium haliotis TaxID=2013869 RepID=UPI00195CC420|nr:nitric oxide reductase [Agaribacterium haliotis]